MAIENQFDEDEELDSAAEGEEGEGGQAGFDAKKIILFVVLPLLLLIGTGAGLHFSGVLAMFTGGGTEEVAGSDGRDSGVGRKKSKKHEITSAFFLEIPNLIVNLSNEGGGQPRYLRLSVHLELGSQSDLDAVEAVMPRVVDQFQTYLRELRVRDLKGNAGIYRLQIELLSRVNAATYPVEIKDVLFQEILIQ